MALANTWAIEEGPVHYSHPKSLDRINNLFNLVSQMPDDLPEGRPHAADMVGEAASLFQGFARSDRSFWRLAFPFREAGIARFQAFAERFVPIGETQRDLWQRLKFESASIPAADFVP